MTDDPDYARAMELHATSISRYRRIESEPRDYPPTEFQLKFVAVSRPIFATRFSSGSVDQFAVKAFKACDRAALFEVFAHRLARRSAKMLRR